jgi:hypothetical protein
MDPDLVAALNDELFARARILSGKRLWPAELHMGQPTLGRCTFSATDPLLHDLILRTLEMSPEPDRLTVWLSRMNGVDALDESVQATTQRAFAAYPLSLSHFVVMDHDSWSDRITGESRSWFRVRPERRRFREVPALGVHPQRDALGWLWM